MLPQIFLLLITIAASSEEPPLITTTKYSKFRVKLTVIHGTSVPKGQAPYVVSIKEPIEKISSKILWVNLCGGSLIASSKVLSAAHCFDGKHYDQLRIVAGNLQNDLIHTGRSETSEKGQWRSISKLKIHPHYYFPLNDIALVIVDSEFIYSSTVDFIIPARKMTDYPRTCIASGYGKIGRGRAPSHGLLWADIYTMSRSQCDTWWEMKMDTFICTNSKASDVAVGDSGGPLACNGTLDPTEERGRYLLVGIVSGKNYDKTTLFTRVSSYDKWLRSDGLKNVACLCEPTKLVVFLCLLITLV